MSDIDDIEGHYTEKNSWYGSFDCPNCNTEWGAANHGDPPADIVETVKCTCGAILRVSGEWVSYYSLEAELVED